ncbi:MAG: chromate efflux transporter [Bacteroidota bacterium]
MIRKVRYYIFLRDILTLSLTSFGGPQAHIAMFLDVLVKKRAYLTEKDLMELYALCQILPGPTSTQTITALGFKVGGPNLAYLTLLVWMLPAVSVMITAGFVINLLNEQNVSLEFLKYIQPIAVGIVGYSAYQISTKVVSTKLGYFLMIFGAFSAYYLRSPFLFPVVIIIGGVLSAFKFKKQPVEEKSRLKINWSNFILWAGVFIVAAVLGGITDYKPVLLFENFYRNGSLIFGGGQVLVPYLHTEFVEFKDYMTDEIFTSGYALSQAIPGPTFSFTAYVGTVSLSDMGYGTQLIGGLITAIAIFLPGTFLIFFITRFWEQLKKYRVIRASLEGVQAVSAGLVIAAAFILFEPLGGNYINYIIIAGTVLTLFLTKVPTPLLFLCGLLAGFIF